MEKNKRVIVVCHRDFKDTAFIDQTLKNVGFKRNTRSRKLVSFYIQHKSNQIICSLREDRGILPSGYNGLRNLKEEIARIFLLKYRNP